MTPKISRLLLGGVAGTFVMTMMMYFVAPNITGRTMDIAAEMGNMMGGSWALGMAVHVMNGVLIFPAAYAFLYSKLPGPPVARGAVWGVALWLVTQLVVMPMIGAGVFSSNIGPKSAGASLISHLVYGSLLGTIAGGAQDRSETGQVV